MATPSAEAPHLALEAGASRLRTDAKVGLQDTVHIQRRVELELWICRTEHAFLPDAHFGAVGPRCWPRCTRSDFQTSPLPPASQLPRPAARRLPGHQHFTLHVDADHHASVLALALDKALQSRRDHCLLTLLPMRPPRYLRRTVALKPELPP